MMAATDTQLDFPSLAFPKDRKVLCVAEVAERWRVSEQHILDLLDEGKLAGFDVAGGIQSYVRVPESGLEALAAHFRVSREFVDRLLQSRRPARRTSRAHWRIPVEGYGSFILGNHSQTSH